MPSMPERYGSPKKKGNTVFDFGTESCIGKTKSVILGEDTFTIALLLTEAQFIPWFITDR